MQLFNFDEATFETDVISEGRIHSDSISGITSRVSTVEALTLCGMIAKVPLDLPQRTSKPRTSKLRSFDEALYSLKDSVDLVGNPIFTLEEGAVRNSLNQKIGEAVERKMQAGECLEKPRCALEEENPFASPLALARAALKQAIIEEAKARYQLLAFEAETLEERYNRTYITSPCTRLADERICLLLEKNLKNKKNELRQAGEKIRCLMKSPFGRYQPTLFSESARDLVEALKQRQRPLSERRVEKMMERHDRLFEL